MKTVKIIIEKTKDQYTAYAENVTGIYGGGDTVVEAKESILKSIHLLKKYNKNKVPKILLSDYQFSYKLFKVQPNELGNYGDIAFE
ncbi:MAG: hypothetical protein C0446_07250 [Chitinophaga sp.]|nr:hypothetical protein [Chitinophaga sp.]